MINEIQTYKNIPNINMIIIHHCSNTLFIVFIEQCIFLCSPPFLLSLPFYPLPQPLRSQFTQQFLSLSPSCVDSCMFLLGSFDLCLRATYDWIHIIFFCLGLCDYSFQVSYMYITNFNSFHFLFSCFISLCWVVGYSCCCQPNTNYGNL